MQRQQDDGEPFADTTNRLVVKLREQRAGSTRLDGEIEASLATMEIPAPRKEL